MDKIPPRSRVDNSLKLSKHCLHKNNLRSFKIQFFSYNKNIKRKKEKDGRKEKRKERRIRGRRERRREGGR